MADALDTQPSLILRLRNPADSAAWNQFAQLYGPALYRFARQQGFQHQDAENLIQEVLVGVARGVHSWSPDPERGRFRAWLFRIARNKSINFLTRPRHRALGTGDTGLHRWLNNHPAPTGELWIQLDQEYRRAVLRRLLKRVRADVSAKTWSAFWWTYIEEMPVATAADRLGMSPGAVHIARSRVLARLNQAARLLETKTGLGPKGPA